MAERANTKNRSYRYVIEHASACNGSHEHGQHTLIAGQAWVRSLNAVTADQVSNPGEKHNQESNDDGQSARAVAMTGSRNALTPLLTASTPVMAVHPLANA